MTEDDSVCQDSPGSESVERARVPDVGTEAPDFELTDHAGRRRRLSELRGSPVLLAFHPAHWDPSWAEYVRAYNRVISASAESNGARLLSVVGAGAWQTLAFDDASLDFPAACIDVGSIAARYGVIDGPAVFVIDPKGRMCWRHVSPDAPPPPNDVASALRATLAVESYDGPHGLWSRRQFVATTLAVTLAVALTRRIARAEAAPAAKRPAALGSTDAVKLRVNGRDLSLELEPRVTLLDALREYSGITGPKKGCDHGQCGIVWGISQALPEETRIDSRSGRYVNADLAEYHVPVNADIGRIDVTFVEEKDEHVNPIGVKGVGEIPIVGVAASVANAVYHATGKRVRDLPITLDKLLS